MKRLFKILLSLFVILVIAIAIGFGYIYHLSEEQVVLPKFTLKNDKQQEIVFITMSHIGETQFYENTIKTLDKLRSEGYVHFYEHVRPASVATAMTQEQKMDADSAIDTINQHIGDSESALSKLVQLTGLDIQHKHMVHLIKPQDIWSDLDIETVAKSLPDASDEHQEKLKELDEFVYNLPEELTEKQQIMTRRLAKVIFNYIIGNMNEMIKGNATFDNALIGDRNQHLLDTYKKHLPAKAVITYGYAHFDDFYNKLKQYDASWTIDHVEGVTVMH
jgi:hypothetical protein